MSKLFATLLVLSASYNTQASSAAETHVLFIDLNLGATQTRAFTIEVPKVPSFLKCSQFNPQHTQILKIKPVFHLDPSDPTKVFISVDFQGIKQGSTNFDCYLEPKIHGGRDIFVTGSATVN